MDATQTGDLLSSLTVMLAIIEMVFVVAVLIISLIFGIVVTVWSLAKMNERSSTRDLIKQLRDNPNPGEKTVTVTEDMLQQLLVRAAGDQASLAAPPEKEPSAKLPGPQSDSDRDKDPNLPPGRTAIGESHDLFRAGHVSLRYGDFESAIGEYSAAIRIAPGFAEAYNARGMAHRKLAEFQKALQDYTAALDLNPHLAAAYNNRGIVHMETREFESALIDFDSAIDLEPDNAYGYCNRAIIYNSMGDFGRSVSDSSKAIELDPNLAEAYVTRGIAKIYSRSDNAAREDFNIAESLGYDESEIKNKLESILGDQ